MVLADLILTRAQVLRMDPAKPRAEAVALAGDRVLAVGSAARIAVLARAEIDRLGVAMTVCGGRITHERPA